MIDIEKLKPTSIVLGNRALQKLDYFPSYDYQPNPLYKCVVTEEDTSSDRQVWLKADADVFTSASAQFSIGAGNYLDAASNSSLQLNDTSFTFCAWVWLDTVSSIGILLSKEDNGAVTGREFDLFYNSVENGFMFSIWTNGTDRYNVLTSTPVINQWYFVVAWYDEDANKIYIQLNNGTPTETDVSGPVQATSTHFTMGLTDSFNLSGRIDNAGFWKRTLTSDERTLLYNGGNGVNYADLTTSIKTNLISWWGLDEATGATREDSHGSNDLADHSSVVKGMGKVLYEASDSDPVDAWLDQTTNGNDASSTSRPTYSTNVIGGNPAISFSHNQMVTQNFSRSQPQTVVAVGQGVGFANHTIVDGSLTNTARIYYADAIFHPYLSADANPITGDSLANETVSVGSWFIAVCVFDGADSRFYVNGEVVTGDLGIGESDGLTIGSSFPGSDDWAGYVAEVMVYSRALSDEDVIAVSDLLNAKYSIY